MGKLVNKFQVGDFVKVVSKNSSAESLVGMVCRVPDDYDGTFQCTLPGFDPDYGYWLAESEVERVILPKRGDPATATFGSNLTRTGTFESVIETSDGYVALLKLLDGSYFAGPLEELQFNVPLVTQAHLDAFRGSLPVFFSDDRLTEALHAVLAVDTDA